jgi:hypothetical protein
MADAARDVNISAPGLRNRILHRPERKMRQNFYKK